MDAITEYGQTDQAAKPPYTFTYFTPNLLPSKYNSKAIDHWGFYNGQNNNTLLPAMSFVNAGYSRYLTGGDRSASISDDDLKKGVLASLTYPTGGSTSFDYELHDYMNLKGQDRSRDSACYAFTYSVPPGFGPSKEIETVTLTDTTAVTFGYGYEKYTEDALDMAGREVVYVNVYKLLPNGTYQAVINFSNLVSCSNPADPACYGSGGSVTMVLLEGTYKIYLLSQQGYRVYANASWIHQIPILQKKGGGLRVKSITNYANGQPTLVRKFYYTDNEQPGGKSVGRLRAFHQYDYDFTVVEAIFSCPVSSYYKARLSGTIYPAGLTSSGTIVGYDKVTEVIGANGEGGKTVHYFYNAEDYNDPRTYPQVPSYSYPLNGNLAVSATFDAAGKLLKKVDYNYRTKESFFLKGVKIYNEPTFPPTTTLSDIYANYNIKFYDNFSHWNVLDSQEEKTYSDQGTFITTKKFFYDNRLHQQVSRTKTLDSKGDTLITVLKYPLDYTIANPSGTPAVALKAMQNKNLITPVIEQSQWRKRSNTDSTLVAASLTQYKQLPSGDVVPDTALVMKVLSPLARNTTNTQTATSFSPLRVNSSGALVREGKYQQRLQYELYDASSHPLQVRPTSGIASSYIWGYSRELPIAEVKNGKADQIAHTSFETDTDKGNWLYTGAGVTDNGITGKTGQKYYTLTTTTSLTKSLPAGTYRLTYWSSDSLVVTGGTVTKLATSLPDANNWVLYEKQLVLTATTVVKLAGSGINLDEVRLHPIDAQMTTYTYDPLVGMTSATDAANVTTYYEYDDLQRLQRIKDQDSNIVQQQIYHYKGQP